MMNKAVSMFETARLFFWLSLIGLVVIHVIRGISVSFPYLVGLVMGAFTVMSAKLAQEEKQSS